jgi:hypothetical protein
MPPAIPETSSSVQNCHQRISDAQLPVEVRSKAVLLADAFAPEHLAVAANLRKPLAL